MGFPAGSPDKAGIHSLFAQGAGGGQDMVCKRLNPDIRIRSGHVDPNIRSRSESHSGISCGGTYDRGSEQPMRHNSGIV